MLGVPTKVGHLRHVSSYFSSRVLPATFRVPGAGDTLGDVHVTHVSDDGHVSRHVLRQECVVQGVQRRRVQRAKVRTVDEEGFTLTVRWENGTTKQVSRHEVDAFRVTSHVDAFDGFAVKRRAGHGAVVHLVQVSLEGYRVDEHSVIHVDEEAQRASFPAAFLDPAHHVQNDLHRVVGRGFDGAHE